MSPARRRRCQLPRQGHGSFDLGEDLILSQDLGAQSAGHFHQMAGTVDSPPGDEGMVKRAGGNPGGLAKQHPGIEILSLAQGEVDFRAVAGGQHHGSPAAQFHHTAVQLRGGGLGKAQLFAQFNGA